MKLTKPQHEAFTMLAVKPRYTTTCTSFEMIGGRVARTLERLRLAHQMADSGY